MTYLDRNGDRIDSLTWLKLYRDAKYSILCTTRRGLYQIITSWIGVKAECEANPRLFLVQVRSGKMVKVGAERHEEFSTASEEWYATEEQALSQHRLLEAQHQLCGKP